MKLRSADLFRRNVRAILDARGMTITALADAANSARPNISDILSGKEGVTLARGDRIARALGFGLAELISPDFRITQNVG